MKKLTAHFNTGSGLVSQTFEVEREFSFNKIAAGSIYIEVNVVGRGRAMIRIADVAFWTYDE